MKKSYVRIPLERWCQICDALSVSPDCPYDLIVKKVNLIVKLKQDYAKELYQLKTTT